MKIKKLSVFIFCVTLNINIFAQHLKTVAYSDGDVKLNGMVTTNTEHNLPGVLILPAWKGIDDEAKEAALNLQQQGYKVFIADIYGEENIPTDNASAAKIAGKYKSAYQAYQHRIQLAINQIVKQGANADKLAVIGYCFGGTGALEAARAGFPVKGVVSIHGGLGKDAGRANQVIHTKVLIENPAEDKSVTPEIFEATKNELKEGKADWQIITYADCGHTFTNPTSSEYNPVMAKRAWQHTLLFLAEVLQ